MSASVNSITAIDDFRPAMLAYIILQSGINYVAIGLADLRARRVVRPGSVPEPVAQAPANLGGIGVEVGAQRQVFHHGHAR